MKRHHLAILAVLAATAASAQLLEYLHPAALPPDESKKGQKIEGALVVKGDYMSANRETGALLATGNVSAVARPYRFYSERVSRSVDGIYTFGTNTLTTTCSNELDHLHWDLRGDFTYIQDQALLVKDAWIHYNDIPVMYVPIWYYPLNTDYGLRVLPGYTSRWGGYLLTKYKYNLINEGRPDSYTLGASTYADYRTENGFAVGQTLRWNLQDYGAGKIKVYNAWDDDLSRYRNHWHDYRYNYSNWGSQVDRRRYYVHFEHSAEFTERDDLRLYATYLSDSYFMRDFFERQHRSESIPINVLWHEHRELNWATGLAVGGPANEFYGGTERLPEGWFSIEPQPIWDLPANYESQTRAGYLNRDYARYGSSNPMYRYNPYIGVNGRGADYQAFRMDTSHRVTLPFKLWDTLSVVPRATYRGTYWSDSGDARENYVKASDDALFRNICEIGFTASTRGSAWLNDTWRHVVEPYLDYSYQKVDISSRAGKRYYVFDNYDRSVDWLDQFGFEGRGLPYNWHGMRPGVRNVFQEMDDKGVLRTILDWDVYAAVPFETMDYQKSGPLAGYPDDDEDGNYNRSGKQQVVPGTRIRWNPSSDVSFLTRAEYDCQNKKAAYADISMHHRLTRDFAYYVSYIGRDHRIWDYLPSNYDRWNYQYSNIIEIGFTHDVCDWLAWSPYIRHDCRRDEVDEVGAWIDYLTDCIGYRVQVAHETAFRRIDGSKYDADNRVMFLLYLRAFGPSSTLDMARF